MGECKLPFEECLAAANGKDLAVGALDDERRAVPVLLHVFFCGREILNAAVQLGTAPPGQWAGFALRIFNLAGGASEFHQGFVVHVTLGGIGPAAGVIPINFGTVLALPIGTFFASPFIGGQKIKFVHPAENAYEVPVQNGFRFVKCKTQDCTCSVRTDSRQCFQFLSRLGKLPLSDYDLCGPKHIACPAVVAEPLPVLENFFFGGFR